MIAYKVQRVTDPAAEPVSLARAKAHLRIEDGFTLDDELIGAYISAARDQAEKYCNRSFASADFFLLLPFLPGGSAVPVSLPDPLTSAVTEISYVDSNGDEQVLSPAEYTLDPDRQEIRPTSAWPSFATRPKVTYTAGPDASASPPETPPGSVIQAMLLLITDMYETREAQIVGSSIAQNPAAELRLSLHRVEMGI